MKLKCLQCDYEFDGTISYDELGWHSACPKCGGSFDVDVTFGDFINTEQYLMADIISFVNTNGEEIEIDDLDDETLQNAWVVETHSSGGYLEIMLN